MEYASQRTSTGLQNYHGKIDKVLEIIREYELKSKESIVEK
jgi:hypothetical protein